MKQFEKWFAKSTIRDIRKSYCRDTWRAALEWVAKRGMHYYGNDFLTDMNELSTDIRIELGHLDKYGHVKRDKDGRVLH